MRCLEGRVLTALDGSEHFCSRKLSCPHCSTRKRADGAVEYFHGIVRPPLVAPGHKTVLPLPPEFVRPQDGAAKQDCDTAAAKRWLARLRPAYAWLKPVYLGADLYARQPLCQALQAVGGHFLLVCKPSSHKTLAEDLTGVELDSLTETKGRGAEKRVYRYRWMSGVPLRDGDDALTVNWLEVEISKPGATKPTCRSSFVTDLPVSRASVADLAACGRARWKIENETFNVLKTGGYHREHNFGHGKDTLAGVLVEEYPEFRARRGYPDRPMTACGAVPYPADLEHLSHRIPSDSAVSRQLQIQVFPFIDDTAHAVAARLADQNPMPQCVWTWWASGK